MIKENRKIIIETESGKPKYECIVSYDESKKVIAMIELFLN